MTNQITDKIKLVYNNATNRIATNRTGSGREEVFMLDGLVYHCFLNRNTRRWEVFHPRNRVDLVRNFVHGYCLFSLMLCRQ